MALQHSFERLELMANAADRREARRQLDAMTGTNVAFAGSEAAWSEKRASLIQRSQTGL